MNIIEFKRSLKEEKPIKWSDMPAMELYMDQVLGFMKNQRPHFDDDGGLTPSMVNNYIKKKVMPRAVKKKYDREHLAYLTIITLLKNVMSVKEMGEIMAGSMEELDIQEFYRKCCKMAEDAFDTISDNIVADMDREELSDMILSLAISAGAQKIACGKLLEFSKRIDG